MQLFQVDEGGYLAWLHQQRDGFVSTLSASLDLDLRLRSDCRDAACLAIRFFGW
jgi:hypothetical protein